MKKILVILSVFFVFLSLFPTIYEISYQKNLPQDRAFELVHNYVFDYNFYLSRIREGQEGRWLVTEKYYNRPHTPSLFQIFYLLLGKLGGLGGLGPPVIYHGARLILGLVLLVLLGKLASSFFTGIWQVIAYLFIVTAGSWPILVQLGNSWRFSSYWGGWSVIDPLLRITFLPHVLAGQIFLVLFVWNMAQAGPADSLEIKDKRYEDKRVNKNISLALLSFIFYPLGLVAGIIFPPVLVTVYVILAVMTVLELLFLGRSDLRRGPTSSRIIFILFSLPALLYTQMMFKVEPWKALAVFDIQHRSILPYTEYALALGPMLPLGILGGLVVLGKLGGLGSLGEREKRLIPVVSWVVAIFLLFVVFERMPQQSPTRFTQMLINVPLGILATFLFRSLWEFYDKYKRSHAFVIRLGIWSVITTIILMGLGVMFSMVGWKMDEVKGKAAGTWLYPVGVQLVYPLKDFMAGIDYLRLNTRINDVVLAYEAAGNYIPAYAGNFVYLGHANTPDEDGKLKIAAKFFRGEMSSNEAKEFLSKENIKYVYFGPQERELGDIGSLISKYSFITPVYTNTRVTIFKFSI